MKRALLFAALLGCVGEIGTRDQSDPGAEPTPTTQADEKFTPSPGGLRRLTVAEYRSTLRDLFGDDVPQPIDLQPIQPMDGFTTIGVTEQSLEELPIAIEKLEAAAREVASKLFSEPVRRAKLIAATDDASIRAYVQKLGTRAFRRPLDEEEIARLVKLAKDVGSNFGDGYRGVEWTTATILASPSFLYRVELGEGGKYSNAEMASRLSYFLWGTTPDDELLKADLSTVDAVRAQARRMIASPRLREGIKRFFGEHLHLDLLDGLPKDEKIFPTLDRALTASMKNEAELLTLDVALDRDGSVLDLFDTNTSFVDGKLATLYGLPAPATPWARVTLPAARAGIISTAAFLAPQGKEHRGSAVLRGLFVNDRFLCRTFGEPPADVDTAALDKFTSPVTMRTRLGEHRKNPACAACHNTIDPIGLPLEHFDGIGAWRDTDQGLSIDATGSIDGATFDGAVGLGKTLKNHPEVPSCLVKQVFRYATGHHETNGELPSLNIVTKRFADSGYRMRALLEELVVSDAFRLSGGLR
jgi:hypothetical protein